jgi:hypothetical protein
MVRGMFTEERDTKEADVDFCRCPFCACCFMSIQDLEKHMATFGSNKEAHSENLRRTHGKIEYGWTSFP